MQIFKSHLRAQCAVTLPLQALAAKSFQTIRKSSQQVPVVSFILAPIIFLAGTCNLAVCNANVALTLFSSHSFLLHGRSCVGKIEVHAVLLGVFALFTSFTHD